MRFLYPALFFGWAALVAAPIILYLLRPRPRTVPTSTLPFFKWLAREHQDSAWLKLLKHLVSLLLSILVIVGGAAVLGRLVVSPPAESLQTVVVLIDRSASMAAVGPDGTTRLEDAVALAGQRLAGLPAGIGVMVVAYDRQPEVLLARSLDRRQVDRALRSIVVRPLEGDAEAALHLANRLAALDTPAAVWHVSDEAGTVPVLAPGTVPVFAPAKTGLFPSAQLAKSEDASYEDEDAAASDVTIEPLSVALAEPVNVGITAFQLRRLALERSRFEAFVQVQCQTPEPLAAELEIKIDGALVALRNLTLKPGARATLLIPVDAGVEKEKTLALELTAAGDANPLDNVVCARIPALRPVSVLWISPSPDPFTELALSSLAAEGDLEVLQGGPSAWPPKKPADVTIFDGWLPAEWPAAGPVIAINPPRSCGPIRAVQLQGGGLPVDMVRATDRGHPLLYGVATGRVAVTQTAVVEAEGSLESVWVGSQGPLLLAGQTRGQRVVVLAFSPQRSEQLPLLKSYPLLIGNAIYWSAEQELESARGMNRKTGEVVPLRGETLVWRDPTAKDAETEVELTGRWTELNRIGLWETDAGETGSAALLSARETVLPVAEEDADDSAADAVERLPLRGDLVPSLLWCMLGLLVIESVLFHRYYIY